jgi:hypothetical protein
MLLFLFLLLLVPVLFLLAETMALLSELLLGKRTARLYRNSDGNEGEMRQ